MTVITNGVDVWSTTVANCPLNIVTLGACSTLVRRSPWAAVDQQVGFDVAQNGEAEAGHVDPVGRTAASPGLKLFLGGKGISKLGA